MEEEEVIRKAAKLINDRIREYAVDYAVRDKQDLLSMCVLHYATAAMNAEKAMLSEQIQIANQVNKLDQLLVENFSG